jgi:hypothetical protein
VWPEDEYRVVCERKSTGGDPDLSAAPNSPVTFKHLVNPWQFALFGQGTVMLHCTVPKRPGVELCGYEVTQ